MNKFLIALFLSLSFSTSTLAATFVEIPENGLYALKCQADEFAHSKPYNPATGTSELSFVRIDVTPVQELAHGTIDVSNGTVVALVSMTVTPGDDAEVVCFAKDRSGNVSDRSVDAAIMDFSSPGKGVIKSN